MSYNDFLFYFVGGTCGSFAKSIFACYIDISNGQQIRPIQMDLQLGHCHGNDQIQHVHYLEHIDQNKQLIVVDFDHDDLPSIVRMAVHKVVQFQIQQDPDFLIRRWGSVFEKATSLQEIEKIFLHNPDFLIFSEWKNNLALLNPVLTLTYKEILFGDINKKIADFFGLTPSAEIAKIILDYRNSNLKYFKGP